METLPHWPTVVEPSIAEMIGLVFGIPALLGLIILLLNMAPRLARMARRGDADVPGAFWVNPGTARPAAIDTDEDDAPYTVGEREALVRAVRRAENRTGIEISVYLGEPENASATDFAIDLLDSLPDPERSLLVFWSPKTEAIEIITGDVTDERVGTAEVDQASAMITKAATSSPVDGIIAALDYLGDRVGTTQPALTH